MNRRKTKPLTPLRTLDKIFRRRYVENTQYYYTNRVISEQEKSYNLIKRPYSIPSVPKIISFAKFNERIVKNDYYERQSRNTVDKDNLNLALRKNIAPRLFIPEPEDDVKDVTSIHPEFFTVIDGRQIRPNEDINRYISDIRRICLMSQELGYNTDMRLAIERDMIEETKIYQQIIDKYKQHIRDFQLFLQEDHHSVKVKADKHKVITDELSDVLMQLSVYNNEIISLTNIVLKCDDARNFLRTYKDFLTKISPLTWRRAHDRRLHDLRAMIKVRASAMDIDAVIEQAREEFKLQEKIEIFFERPEQIASMFDAIELQCRDYLVILASRCGFKNGIKLKLNDLNRQITEQESYFRYFITLLEENIETELERSNDLIATFFELLNGSFFESYASIDSLKLAVSVMFVFEAIVGRSDNIYQNLTDPLRVIEQLYEDLNMELENLEPTIVNRAKQEYFLKDKKAWYDATIAELELKRYNELTKSLKKSFDPPMKPDRTAKYDPRVNKPKSKSNLIEKDSTEYVKRDYCEDLLFFTEWCGQKNDANLSRYLDDYFTLIKPVLEEAQDILDF